MPFELGIDRSLVQFGAAAAVNDRARLRRRCCASSLTAAAAPKQGLAVRSMPGCAFLGIRRMAFIPGKDLARQEQMERSIDPKRATFRATQRSSHDRQTVWSARRGTHLGSGHLPGRINRPNIWTQAIRSKHRTPTSCEKGAVHIWVASSAVAQTARFAPPPPDDGDGRRRFLALIRFARQAVSESA